MLSAEFSIHSCAHSHWHYSSERSRISCWVMSGTKALQSSAHWSEPFSDPWAGFTLIGQFLGCEIWRMLLLWQAWICFLYEMNQFSTPIHTTISKNWVEKLRSATKRLMVVRQRWVMVGFIQPKVQLKAQRSSDLVLIFPYLKLRFLNEKCTSTMPVVFTLVRRMSWVVGWYSLAPSRSRASMKLKSKSVIDRW